MKFEPRDSRVAVVPGDWDLSDKLFCDSDIFIAMKSVLKDRSCAWAETTWYANLLQRMEAGQTVWECGNKVDLQKRLAAIERAYSSNLGQGDSRGARWAASPPNLPEGEVGVAIGRSGELFLCGAASRLCLALLLGIDRISVRVEARHPAWAGFRAELLAYARSEGGSLYQPALHCDLGDIPSSERCEERWRLISPHLVGGGGTVLDIGANLGFFDNRLEDLGYECIAIDSDATAAYFMRHIRDANRHHFEIITDSVSSNRSIRGRHYDVVLALSVLHHFLKTSRDYASLECLLDELDCEEMFFEPHVEGEPQMAGAYAGLTPEAFTQLVARRTGLTMIEALGESSNRRKVYHLRRAV